MPRSAKAIARAKKNYLARHPERRAASVAAYYERNKEKIAAYHRARYQAKKDEIYAKHKEWRRANPKAAAAEVMRWRAKNPDKVRVYKATTRARRKRADGVVSPGLIGRLHMEQHGACRYCRAPLIEYHLDHRMPIALGGRTEDENLQLLCPPCNRAKGAKHPDVFERQIRAAA